MIKQIKCFIYFSLIYYEYGYNILIDIKKCHAWINKQNTNKTHRDAYTKTCNTHKEYTTTCKGQITINQTHMGESQWVNKWMSK